MSQRSGVRRISVGGALARAAWGGFLRAARTLAEQGRFDGLADALSGQHLNAAFGNASGPHPDALERRP
jgi:2-methylisocitrate lyase-like PEP mutase family enzyme